MAPNVLPPIRINGYALQPRDEVHRRKLEALRAFTQSLLASPVQSQIAKIILFGSVAKGEIRPESDVDVAIYGFGDLQTLREQVYDAAQETWCQKQESIEPLIDDGYALLEPVDYFTYRVAHHGAEVYTMLSHELKRQQVHELFDLAQDYLVGAEDARAAGHLRLAADAAYNAAELCLKGLLYFKLNDIPGSHTGVVDKFGELYCKPEILPRELGRRVRQGLEIRSQARYRPTAEITAEKAGHNLALARELIRHLDEALEGDH
jgi:uncharacterized protein (UPF0332 family)